MSELHNEKARNILASVRYASVATVTPEGKPWNTAVAHELDDANNLYWVSDKEGQHSKNVRANPHAFIVIYDSTAPDGEGEGVFMEVEATELNDAAELRNLRNAKGEAFVGDADEFVGDGIRRWYKAVPKRIWINDAEEEDGKFIRDYRVEARI